MANTYTWNFPQLEVYPQYASETNVVFTVHWILTGSDDSTPPVTAQVYGTQSVVYADGSSFTPYDQLTEEQVQGWVVDAMGPDQLATLQENLDQQIANIINPPSQNLPPPWYQPCGAASS